MANPEKAAVVAELQQQFTDATAVVLTEYRGLSVADLKTLRRSLGESADYAIVKNTLTAIAAKNAGYEGLDDQLSGPTAIAFVKGDVVTVAKGLRDFAKANPLLVIKGGYLDGQVLDAEKVKKLASLESREVLLAKLAGAMNGNLAKAAGLFNAALSQAARLFAALQTQKEAAPAAPAAEPEAAEAPAEPVVEAVAEPAAEAPAEAAEEPAAEASAEAAEAE
ncbi:MAG: 50S ribosomal protein L10 [Propionibacteriaceae bacterium]|jgi:large subunit ribosomal protein L10|nr:50S ribosomal protein L10 [Propionibacteriaceae bacterium]